MFGRLPLSTLLSHVLVAFTIELDNEFERRFTQAGGGARVASLVMWSNFLRFVGDGIAVGDLPAAVELQTSRVLSTLGSVERWRYVFVAPAGVRRPPKENRDGYGSARGLKDDWVVRLTPAGQTAVGIWPALFGEIEARWLERFGPSEIEELEASLRTIEEHIDVELPEYLPIVGGSHGMRADLRPSAKREGSASGLQLLALLAHALLAHTLDYERESELSLPLSANIVRVLDESGVLVRDLPRLSGVSNEAIAMALTFLAKTGYVSLAGTSTATKLARLTPAGQRVRREHRALVADEADWTAGFGAETVARLRSALERLHESDQLAGGLRPYSEGWRSSHPYAAHTQAMIDDPRANLPHYPMVLHRGGWPDGS